MEEKRYIVECYSKDAMVHGFPEFTRTCVSPTQVTEIIAECTREFTGINEIRITFSKKETDYDWAKYWQIESQISRNYEYHFRNEIARYLPEIDFMSFAGAKAIVDWIFKKVVIKDEKK